MSACIALRDDYDTRRRVLLHLEERPAQRVDRDMVEKRRETHPWLPSPSCRTLTGCTGTS